MNPLAASLFVLPVLLADGFRGALDLADRTELRGGYFGLPTDPALNAETVPSLSLSMGTRSSEFNLTYAPRLALTDLQLGFYPSQLQSGSAFASWHSRAFRVSLSEYASYGTLNYSALQLPSSTAPGAFRVDPFLRRIISYEGSSTALNLLYTPVKRWATRLTMSYSLSGAAKESDRDVLPLFYGPRVEAAVEYAFLHRSWSFVRGYLEKTTVSTGFEYVLGQGAAGVRHRLATTTEAEVAGGVTEVRTDLPGPQSRRLYDTYPTVEGTLTHRIPYRDRFDLLVRAALAPGINRTTGFVTQQIQALGRASLRSYPWVSTFESGIADSIHDQPGRLTIISGQLAVGYFITRVVEVEVGGRLAWQKLGIVDTTTFQRLAFVALTLREPTLHF